MKLFPFPFLLAFAVLLPHAATADKLSPENIESIRQKLRTLEEDLKSHLSSKNVSAGERFATAAQDPRAAVDLYLKCHKLVRFERENRPDSDYRAWEDDQSDRLRGDRFVESLQLQLRYLALSCRAAEAEERSEVFSELLSYVDRLSRMEHLPTDALTDSVGGSIFAQAYHLERLLGQNDNWEPTPFDIGGIYDRTILPYLRQENPTALPNAWDKRIEQQTRIVSMIEEHKQDQLRGLNRDEERRMRTNQNRQRGIMGDLDKEDFYARTLPQLKWNKMKDVFLYVSEVQAAQAMLPFVEEHLTHELGEQFHREFLSLIAEAEETPGNVAPSAN